MPVVIDGVDLEAELARLKAELMRAEPYAALGRQVAAMAHQLNNPLSIVIGRAAMLEETLATNPPAQAEARRIREAGERCGGIVRGVLHAARQAAGGGTAPRAAARNRLLLVGDAQALTDSARQVLAADGHDFDQANGTDALQRLHEQPYAAVLCHLQMRPLDGWQFWRTLRRQHPLLAARVVFLSSEALSVGIRSFMAETGCPVLCGPLEPEPLRHALQAVLRA